MKKMDALAPITQAQEGSRIPSMVATLNQRSEESIHPTRPPVPNFSMPMFLEEVVESPNEGLDTYFTQCQGKSVEFKQTII